MGWRSSAWVGVTYTYDFAATYPTSILKVICGGACLDPDNVEFDPMVDALQFLTADINIAGVVLNLKVRS